MYKERIDRGNFLRLEAYMEEQRLLRKVNQRAFQAKMAEYDAALNLFERRGDVYASKVAARARLEKGTFKLIEGVLRWRDGEDASKLSHLPASDPRHRQEESAFLRSILSIGPVKPWTWAEEQRPTKPTGPTGGIAAAADADADADAAVQQGENEPRESNGTDTTTEEGAEKKRWAEGQKYATEQGGS